MIFSLLRLLVFLPLVSSKFYNFKLELISPCDGKLQINFVKLNHIFPFYANQPLFIDNWYLYIHSIIVHYITSHYIAANCIALLCFALHDVALHYTTLYHNHTFIA